MLLALLPFMVQAQFSESFAGLSGFTSGWGTMLPTGWVQYNQDGLTPFGNLATKFGTAGWVSATAGGDTFAISTSYYTSPASSDDWLVTPTITVPTATAGSTPWLLWEALAPDQGFPDGYLVKISTTGNAVANFTAPAAYTEAAAPGTFEGRGISLAAYSGQQINVAFINNSHDMYLLYLDDVKVVSLPTIPEVELVSMSVPNRVAATSSNVSISGTIKNNSGVAITSVTATWDAGMGPQSATISGLNVAPTSMGTFTHTIPFNSANVDEYTITLTVSNPNGSADPTPANNSGSTMVSTVAELPVKTVLIEEGTGTWCGWCPRGAVAMDYMYATYAATGQFVGIAVHNGDPMKVTAYDDGANLSSFPGCNVDRVLLGKSVSQNAFNTYYNDRKTLASPAPVNMALNFSGTSLTVDLSTTFKTKMTTGLRFAAVIVEDSVHDASYDQTNYYANNAQGAMGGFEALPDPVPGAQMWYGHVGRELLGGYDGQTGSIPAVVNNGDAANYTFNYTVPATMNQDHVYVVGMLIDETSGEVYNATMKKLTGNVSINPAAVTNKFEVYPNPASNVINLSFELNKANDVMIDVYNTTGQKVMSEVRSGLVGEQNITLDTDKLVAGTYLVSISYNGNSYIKNISIVK